MNKMKYSETNPPVACIQRHSTCYQGTTRFTPRGILWHSTGCNNPKISRYVQPLETDADYGEKLALLGKNPYGNDWNHTPRQAGLNAFIGKLADGSVSTVQTMPWNYAPWGCGSGKRGTLNSTHIQFEICEDDLSDAAYFEAVYWEACQLTAYLCQMYDLDPLGSFTYLGVEVPVITSHDESHDLGLGSNHGDPTAWLKKYGKSMQTVRKDVAAIMSGKVEPAKPTPAPQGNAISLRTLSKGSTGEDVKALQILLNGYGFKLDIDGSFGPKTQAAVKAFQKMVGLVVDGIVGVLTWRKLLGVD